MNPACIAEIAQAIGRNPTRADLEAFQGGLTQQMRELARRDRTAWQSMSHEQRLQAAADAAAREAVASADKAAQRKASNLLAQSRETQRLTARAEQKAQQGSAQAFHDALFERLVQVDTYISGLRNEALSDMLDAINAVEGRFLNLMDDPAKVQAFAKAVLDGDTSDPAMAKAAKAYIDTMEALRNRANAAGADIGKLDYAYLPQPHDTGKIARTGVDKWVADVLPRLDRERYVAADGSLMTDDQVADLLRGAWTTLATEGRSKMEPGAARGGNVRRRTRRSRGGRTGCPATRRGQHWSSGAASGCRPSRRGRTGKKVASPIPPRVLGAQLAHARTCHGHADAGPVGDLVGVAALVHQEPDVLVGQLVPLLGHDALPSRMARNCLAACGDWLVMCHLWQWWQR